MSSRWECKDKYVYFFRMYLQLLFFWWRTVDWRGDLFLKTSMERHTFTRKKWPRRWRWVVLLLLIVVVRVGIALTRPISLTKTVVVTKWDTINVFLADLQWREKMKLKAYIKTNDVDLGSIQLGTYQFSGSYSPEEFVDVIEAGPISEYVRFTVLEWRSIYDVDKSLTEKNFIDEGQYVTYVSSGEVIQRAAAWYGYIADAYQRHDFPSLEGWLYPDTYFIDPSKDVLSQLVRLQLKAFDEKVYQPYASAITSFPSLLQAKWITISYTMDLWNILRLASVIEKEERNIQNKPTVAGIFFNRLEQGTLLWADITLCYGLHEPYETCTPAIIGRYIKDADNAYNTRVHRWLPPTPIANPSVESMRAVLEFEKTNYFYYLHDNNGVIRYAETLQWHNDNISKYLK